MELTHDALSRIAAKWLRRPFSGRGPGCHVALIEVGGYSSGEIADAWGYRYDVVHPGSVLVEAKVSRADFLADAKKPHRNGEILGVGTYRYYICPEGLIEAEELPARWGLLWVNTRGHVKVKAGHIVPFMQGKVVKREVMQEWAHEANAQRELMYMGHALNRLNDPQAAIDAVRWAANLERQNAELKEQVGQLNKELLYLNLNKSEEVWT